jgi:hypothetical protein
VLSSSNHPTLYSWIKLYRCLKLFFKFFWILLLNWVFKANTVISHSLYWWTPFCNFDNVFIYMDSLDEVIKITKWRPLFIRMTTTWSKVVHDKMNMNIDRCVISNYFFDQDEFFWVNLGFQFGWKKESMIERSLKKVLLESLGALNVCSFRSFNYKCTLFVL